MMYRLNLFPYEINGMQIEDDFYYIITSFIPGNGEIIEKIKVCVENDNEETDDYLLKVKVKEVHYEIFDDCSSMPILYGQVIGVKKVESDE